MQKGIVAVLYKRFGKNDFAQMEWRLLLASLREITKCRAKEPLKESVREKKRMKHLRHRECVHGEGTARFNTRKANVRNGDKNS